MLEAIQNIDFMIIDAIQEHLRCGFLDAVIPVMTHFGIVIWIAAALLFMYLKKYRKCGISMGAGMIMGLLVGNLILKNLIARDRPCWINDSIQLLIEMPDDFSFPSGHTLASFISAIIIFRHSKKLGIPALLLACLMAFTRLYLYVHFPTDILGGIILAVIIAIPVDILATKIVAKIKTMHESNAHS